MTASKDRIKIAIQKSGRLTDQSLDLLGRCGLKYSRARDQLICFGENMPVDVLLVRDDDIPGLVHEDVCDLGIVGQNIILERRLELSNGSDNAPFQERTLLDFGQCRLAFGIGEQATVERPVDGQRVATSYPEIVKDFLQRESIDATVVKFSGAVEIAPSLGKADLICDLVSTGATMKAHGMREGETVLKSRAQLIQTPVPLSAEKLVWVDRLMRRIDGVLQVKESKYIMLHAPRAALAEIRDLLPGSEAPTIIPLEGLDDKVAVHAVCRETVFWETLEDLQRAGATSVLVLPVEKMLA
jgi:ATP phosphoribosyltransferase